MPVDVKSEIDIDRPRGEVAAYLAAAMRRANRKDLARPKAVLETRVS